MKKFRLTSLILALFMLASMIPAIAITTSASESDLPPTLPGAPTELYSYAVDTIRNSSATSYTGYFIPSTEKGLVTASDMPESTWGSQYQLKNLFNSETGVYTGKSTNYTTLKDTLNEKIPTNATGFMVKLKADEYTGYQTWNFNFAIQFYLTDSSETYSYNFVDASQNINNSIYVYLLNKNSSENDASTQAWNNCKGNWIVNHLEKEHYANYIVPGIEAYIYVPFSCFPTLTEGVLYDSEYTLTKLEIMANDNYDASTIYSVDLVTVPSAITGAGLTLNNDIDVNVNTYVPAGSENVKMKFEVNGKEAVTVNGVKDATNSDSVSDVYSFTYEGLLPQNITDNIKMTLMIGENAVATKATYSVKEYCTNKLADIGDSQEEADTKLKDLLNAILAYGAAAQVYAGYKTDALVATVPTYDYTAIANAITSAIAVSGDDIWSTANVTLQSKIGLTVTATANTQFTVTKGEESTTLTTNTSGAMTFSGIGANELATAITFTNGTSSVTLSVNACIKALLEDDSVSENAKNLAAALYNYGIAATAYSV